MSKTIEYLKARKIDLEKQLESYRDIVKELDDVNKAIDALEDKNPPHYVGDDAWR